VFRAREEEGEFYILFGRLKDDGQQFFKYFRMNFWNWKLGTVVGCCTQTFKRRI